MSDAAIFVAFFGGLVVVRVIVATIVFCYLLPASGRCPNCDGATLWVQSRFLDRVLPWLRSSWCPSCRWEGVLRHGRRRAAPVTAVAIAKATSRQPGTRPGSRRSIGRRD